MTKGLKTNSFFADGLWEAGVFSLFLLYFTSDAVSRERLAHPFAVTLAVLNTFLKARWVRFEFVCLHLSNWPIAGGAYLFVLASVERNLDCSQLHVHPTNVATAVKSLLPSLLS